MSRRRQANAGFVMPAILVVIAVVTLVFLTVILALDSLSAEARSAREDIRFRQTALTAEAELAWLMTTEPFTARSLAIGQSRAQLGEMFGEPPADDFRPANLELFLDGRSYTPAIPATGGRIYITLQDQGGLVNLNNLTPLQSQRLFERMGASQNQAGTLAARLIDYIDADDFRQPDGAEIGDYEREGAGRPQNGVLVRVDELMGVLGFREMTDRPRVRALRDTLSADPTTGALNVNTMTPEAMAILFGVAPDRVSVVTASRESAPFVTFEEFAAAAGVAELPSGDFLTVFPSGRVAFKALDARRGIAYRSRITVTPSDNERPLWVDDRSFSPMTAEEGRADHSDAQPLPVAAP